MDMSWALKQQASRQLEEEKSATEKQLNLSEWIYRRDIFFLKWGQQLLFDIEGLDFLTKYKEITMQKACGMPGTKYKW